MYFGGYHHWTKTLTLTSSSSSYSTPPHPPSSSTTVAPPTSVVTTTALPTQPPPSSMPSLTTTFLTSVVTLTSFGTVTTGQYLPPDIVGPIEGLDECSQTIVFESLANSQCNPANFSCICDELRRLGVEGRIAATCSAPVTEQYARFQRDVCHNVKPVHPTTTTTIIVSTSALPISATTAPPVNVTTTVVPVNVTSVLPVTVSSVAPINGTTTQGPFGNTTIPVSNTGAPASNTGAPASNTGAPASNTGAPASNTGAPAYTTAAPIGVAGSTINIVTTNSAGEATTIQTVVGPAEPSSTAAPVPAIPSAAAGLQIPEFGTVRAVMLAGALGLMGLVFAEL